MRLVGCVEQHGLGHKLKLAGIENHRSAGAVVQLDFVAEVDFVAKFDFVSCSNTLFPFYLPFLQDFLNLSNIPFLSSKLWSPTD